MSPVNGRDWDTSGSIGSGGNAPPREDLQYACIFPLLSPRDCEIDPDNCDCARGSEDKPLCEQVPGTSVAGTTQYWAKAYPGTRHLEVLKGHGANSIVASICARNLQDDSRSDFGYRPAIAALMERIKTQLPSP